MVALEQRFERDERFSHVDARRRVFQVEGTASAEGLR